MGGGGWVQNCSQYMSSDPLEKNKGYQTIVNRIAPLYSRSELEHITKAMEECRRRWRRIESLLGIDVTVLPQTAAPSAGDGGASQVTFSSRRSVPGGEGLFWLFGGRLCCKMGSVDVDGVASNRCSAST